MSGYSGKSMMGWFIYACVKCMLMRFNAMDGLTMYYNSNMEPNDKITILIRGQCKRMFSSTEAHENIKIELWLP
jgi:hypothetical protein